MGIASLILGIIAFVTGWIPFICFISIILAIVGLILGIVDTIHKNKSNDNKRGISMAGLIVSAIAIPVVIFGCIFSFILFAIAIDDNNAWDDDYDYYYNDEIDEYFTNRNWYKNYYNVIDYKII